ncbi:MAG: HAMP domain-containing histidine kinase [Ruminococcus sp.]|nr:HAMP domain-containing histidine kinase [Ruminococcus sp.]
MYFMIFTVLILVLLWVFQYFFLAGYYRSARIRSVSNTAETLINAYNTGDADFELMRAAFDNSLCIVITDSGGKMLKGENNLGSFSRLLMDAQNDHGYYVLHKLSAELADEGKDQLTKIEKNEYFKSEEIIFCRSFVPEGEEETCYIYIEASVEPIDSTVGIIREQLIYITIILFELAFIITMFISKRLSNPIVNITDTAKKFAGGDFSVEFGQTGKSYQEITELSEVLDKAKDEIGKVNKLRADLIANISHDLRTPLTMVKAYAEMIRDFSGDIPEKRNEHVGIIIDEADRLSNLVSNILELSKLESGNLELNCTEFSLHDKIRDILTRYTLLIEQNGYDIAFESDEDRIIRADADKLDQVLYNFINNAINYSGENKVIRVRQLNREDCTRIEVTDNGKGISKELLPKVFDRYYRGDKVQRDVVGTGLGLSICKEILKKHGFAFGVLSEEGKGSTFWFEIPFEKPHKQSRKSEKAGEEEQIPHEQE